MEKLSRRKFLQLGALACGSAVLTGCHKNDKKAFGGGEYKRSSKQSTARSWGMLIDMDKLTNLEEIQAACHKFHNVPKIPDEAHEVKWIWGEDFGKLFLDLNHKALSEEYKDKEFVALCNHCAKPVCVKVCPTQATFSSEEGIVLMDMHRCIGCRNCMAACPYGSRSFNFYDPRKFLTEINPEYPTRMKGVVEKCDFCYERLREGKQPICVEKSKGAIIVGDIDDQTSEISRIIANYMTIQRMPGYGTEPKLFYRVHLKEESEEKK